MKVEHSVEIDGIKATLVFEVLSEGLEFFGANRQCPPSGLDTEFSAHGEVFRNLQVSEKAQSELLEMHGELYRSLVDSSLRLLTKDL